MAYKEIYKLPFQSITGNDYSVRIEKDGYTGSSTELVGSRNPFRLETMIGNVFEPMLLSTATLKIFGGDYLQSLFTPNPQGVRVKLLKNNILEWVGYITNDTYSQDYSSEEFEYEIELVNPISTLKYKKYDGEDGLVTIISLIKEALNLTNAGFSAFYLPTSITNSSNQNVYDLIKISTANFYDEQDEPMKWYEVLEEIAKYLCLTLTVYKNSVYFIDWKSLKTGHNQYYKYVGNTATIVTLTDTNTIQNLDYSSDSHSLSINSGKNKVKVTCSMYDIDGLLPTFDDKDSVFVSMEEEVIGDRNHIIRHFKQPKFTFYKYTNGNKNSSYINDEPTKNTDTGASFIRTSNYDTKNIPTSLSFKDTVAIKRYLWDDAHHSNYDKYLTETDKIFSFKSKQPFSINPEIYLLINYEFQTTNTIFPKLGVTNNNEFSSKKTTYLKASLRVGNYYYNGTSWVTTVSTFKIPTTIEKGTRILNVWRSPDNTNTFDLGIGGSEGFVIKTPTHWMYGDVEFTIYMLDYPYDVVGLEYIGAQYVHLSNIEVSYGIPSNSTIYGDWKDEKNDVVYENEISDNFEEEADSIDLKICTFPEDYTKLCYSTTYLGTDLLKSLIYKPLNITDIPEKIIINKVIDYYKNPKYQLTVGVQNKELKPYTLITDQNSPNKVFCCIGNEIDYEFESNNINLIEI